MKKFDPDGKRTVGEWVWILTSLLLIYPALGVLTKPDRIPLGEEESWLQLIRNETEPLINNWFCVKQPSSHTLAQGITWAEARQQESEFFSSTKPWCHLDSHYEKFLRTTNLTERLSVILTELISKRCVMGGISFILSTNLYRLPEIQEELCNIVMGVEQELKKLPSEPPGDPVAAVLQVLECFKMDLAKRLEGTPDEDGVIQRVRTRATAFKHAIHRTIPSFVPWERKKADQHPIPFSLVSFAEDDGDDGRLPSNSNHIYLDEVMRRAQKSVFYIARCPIY